MPQQPLAGDRMTDAFFVVPAGMSRAEAQRRVREEHLLLGIVAGDDRRYVIGAEGLAPLLLVDARTPLQAILDSAPIMSQINAGAPGVIVLDNDRYAGVVGVDTLRAYYLNEYRSAPSTLGDGVSYGDATLPGLHTQPPIVIICDCCGARNDLDGLVVGRTMCVNGHVLCVNWD